MKISKPDRKPTSVLKQLILLFFIIVVPIIATGISIQMLSNRQLQSNILSTVTDRISVSIRNIDTTIAQTNEHVSDILSNKDVSRLSNPYDQMSSYDRATKVNYVRALMYNIRYGNPYANNVCLYLPAASVLYNTENAYDNTRKNRLSSQGIITEELHQELLDLLHSPQTAYVRNDQLVFLQASSFRDPKIIVEISYMIPELEAMFAQTLLYDHTFYLFTMNNNEFTVTNCTDETLLAKFSDVSDNSFVRFKHEGVTYCAFSFLSHETNGIYTQLIPSRELFMHMEYSTNYSIVFTVIVLLFLGLFIFRAFQIIHTPIRDLSNGLSQIEASNFDVQLNAPRIKDFEYVYNHFNKTSQRLKHLIQQELQHEILLNKAQLKQLQAQINPHFLYNSFFILKQMLEREMYEEAHVLAKDLGYYFRYITRSNADEVPLKDEYEHVRNYIAIQSMRFYGKMEAKVDELPVRFHDLMVPRLILQPIVENAFAYGIEPKIRDSLLRISFQPTEDMLIITIEDNGDNLSPDALASLQHNLRQITDGCFLGEMTGLLNIYKRLLLYFDQTDVMQLSRSSLGGLQITIKLYKQEDPHVSLTNC